MAQPWAAGSEPVLGRAASSEPVLSQLFLLGEVSSSLVDFVLYFSFILVIFE